MPDLKLHQEMLPTGVAYIEAEGFLDAHTFEDMDNLVQAVFRQGAHKLIVRLEKLDYISSAGAGVFVGSVGQARENGGDIVFLRPSASVKEVFDLLGLTAIFRFAETREDAEGCF